ncbi:MAG: transposase, partial [Anaerolineae bacterium]|nr:transposase [Anaerolineae bacterium]
MDKYATFSPRCSMVAVGLLMRRLGLWSVVEALVHIRQKTGEHTPVEKLLDAFIILAGGQGVCEVNTRVRPDYALQR